jgi:hypothetical protein
MPPDLYAELTNNHSRLQALVNKCRTSAASAADRTLRNSLLKSTVGLCLLQVRIWAYGQLTAGILTADDVHLLGFLLPGESGGHHGRTEATDEVAEGKVKVINEDNIRIDIPVQEQNRSYTRIFQNSGKYLFQNIFPKHL